jgi:hypothetical protein
MAVGAGSGKLSSLGVSAGDPEKLLLETIAEGSCVADSGMNSSPDMLKRTEVGSPPLTTAPISASGSRRGVS